MNAIHALSQLSYSPNSPPAHHDRHRLKLVARVLDVKHFPGAPHPYQRVRNSSMRERKTSARAISQ